MKDYSATWGVPAIASMALLVSACIDGGNVKPGEMAEAAMLLDKEARPASRALIRLQERPEFPRDDKGRPFAMLDDRTDQAQREEKPLKIREPKR